MLELLEHTAELALERTLERTNTVNAAFNKLRFNNFLHFLTSIRAFKRRGIILSRVLTALFFTKSVH